jgi:RND family efflux transporter MFP subunit
LIPGALLLLVAAGCGEAEVGHAAAGDQTPVPVKVAAAVAKPMPQVAEVVGTVQAKLRAVIEAKMSGRIEKMPARLGQVVKQGDPLVQLDAREIQARVDQAAATREQAETDLKRLTVLLQQQALTQAEFDAAQARFRVADGALREAQTSMGYAKVIAPFDGVIVRKMADVGDLAAPGRPLLEMEDSTQMRFIADVPEAFISQIKPGAEMVIKIEPGGQRLKGKVVEIAPTGDPVSRTSRIELDLSEGALRSGSFGRLLVPTGEVPMLIVPAGAVVPRGQLEIVFVVKSNRAHLRLVKSGRRVGDGVEILSGLSSGEQIVIENAAELQDGQPVSEK